MSIDHHIRRGHPIVCSVIIFFALIELAISAWLTSRFTTRHDYSFLGERDRTRFVLFASVWTLFFAALYMTVFQFSAHESAFTSVLSYGIFFLLTWIIWTAAASSVTVMLGGGLNCGTQTRFVYCGQLNAMLAFSWIIWILVAFCIGVVIMRGIIAARRGDGTRAQMADSE